MKKFGLLLILGLAACGGTVAHSEPVSVKIGSLKEGEIRGSAFDMSKSIDDDSDKPYAAFLAAARAELDGEDPEAIEVDSVVLAVASESKGIGTDGFASVVKSIEVYLAKSDTTVVVGRLAEIEAGTTIEVPVDATSEQLRVLRPNLLKGDFEVGLRGDAVEMRPADFELRTNVQITFRAIGP